MQETKNKNLPSLVKKQNGTMLVLTLVATGLFLVTVLGAISLVLLQQKLNIRKVARAQSLHIAEAGVNYYRWLLYHDQDEYCNYEACQPSPDYGPYGPYSYTDSSGDNITGYYNLYITPPPLNGSTVVRVISEGWTADYPNVKRRIEVRCGIPSWTTFANLVNSVYSDEGSYSYGMEATIYGPVHANNTCISNEGEAHDIMTSSLEHCGTEWGVYTSSDPSYPTAIIPPEKDNFLGGRDYGPHIPIVSFDVGVGGDYLNRIFDMATSADGILIDPRAAFNSYSVPDYRNCGAACLRGFHITFRTDNKFDVSMVSAYTGTGNYSIGTQSATKEFYVPANGVIFVMHTVWVDGLLNNATGTRATIFAFKDPINQSPPGNCYDPITDQLHVYITDRNTSMADIIIADNLRYQHTDGSDALGLVAQRHVTFANTCPNNTRVDAALLARWGKRKPQDFTPNKNQIWLYGQTASYCAPSMSDGYNNRVYEYDNNLTFAPPPHYPSSGQYTFISWKEE